jgi:Gar1/Naf1 RNA binding region
MDDQPLPVSLSGEPRPVDDVTAAATVQPFSPSPNDDFVSALNSSLQNLQEKPLSQSAAACQSDVDVDGSTPDLDTGDKCNPPLRGETQAAIRPLGHSLNEAGTRGEIETSTQHIGLGDACSSSSSSSTSSSDSDSDSHLSPARETKRILECMVDADGDNVDEGPMRTKNETDSDALPIPALVVELLEDHTLVPVGKIKSIMEKAVVIESLPGALSLPSETANPYAPVQDEIANSRALESETILFCVETRTPLGRIFETFGPVMSPFYIVRFNSSKDIEMLGDAARVGRKVAFVSEMSTVIRAGDIRDRGYDASNLYDEEIVNERQEHSDDEAEAASKRAKKRTTGGAARRGTPGGDPCNADENSRHRPSKRSQLQSQRSHGGSGNFSRGSYSGVNVDASIGNAGPRGPRHTGWPSNRNQAQTTQRNLPPQVPTVQPRQAQYGQGGPRFGSGMMGSPAPGPMQPPPLPIFHNGVPVPSIHPMLAQHNQFPYQLQPLQHVVHPYSFGVGGTPAISTVTGGGSGMPMIVGAAPSGPLMIGRDPGIVPGSTLVSQVGPDGTVGGHLSGSPFPGGGQLIGCQAGPSAMIGSSSDVNGRATMDVSGYPQQYVPYHVGMTSPTVYPLGRFAPVLNQPQQQLSSPQIPHAMINGYGARNETEAALLPEASNRFHRLPHPRQTP